MKSEMLKEGDKVLVTQDFLEAQAKLNCINRTIWRLGDVATVDKLSEFSTVKIRRGIWSLWITNPLAENMHLDYLAKQKGFVV